MDNVSFAVLDVLEDARFRWMVFTVNEQGLLDIDPECSSFGEIIDKYGPIPAIPLPHTLADGVTEWSL